MRPLQPRSLSWTAADVLVRIAACQFTWREICVLRALVDLAKPGGRVYVGNTRLAETASALGPSIAAGMGLRRVRFPLLGKAFLGRILSHLIRRGIIDRFIPRLGPTRRYFRVLRLRIEGLDACARWGEARRRAWRSSCDPTPPSAPRPRIYSWRMRRFSNRRNQYAYTSKGWWQHYGPEWEVTD